MKKFDEKNVENLWALTPMQEGMLFHYLKNPGNNDYFEQLILEISGKIEVEIFEKAWNFVIRTNEMLRTVFRWRPVKKPVQLVLKDHNFKVNYKETEADIEEPFDLQEVPFRVTLGKIEDNRYRMVVANHHILYDGWSNRIILEEFFAAYKLLSKGEGLKQPVKTSFKEFIKWLQHQDKQQQRYYWQAYLEGFSHGTRLGEITAARYRENEPPGNGKRVKSLQTRLTESLRKLLEQRAAKYKLTPAVIFYTAWGILLQKCTNCNDVVVGTTVSGRNAPVKGIENMVGLFINTVPFRVQDHGSETIKHMLERLQSALQERSKYESTPLVDIRRYSEHNFDNELFDTLVVVENYPLAFDDRLLPGDDMFSIESYNMVEHTHYDLSVGISLFDEIDIRFIYDSSIFNDDMAAALANRFISIINFILEQPGKSSYEIDILSKKEKRQLLIDFNDTGADYPRNKTLHRLFEEQVARTPDSTAVTGVGTRFIASESRNISITYNLLNNKSHQLAMTLQEKGVTPDTIVAIMLERSVEMITGLLGILKAGGAYLPIDPDYPQERIEYMLSDSGAKILLTEQEIAGFSSPQALYLSEGRSFTNDQCPMTNDQLAYIIYTSGTTGKPKGTLIEHKNVVRLLFNDKFTNLFTFNHHDTWTLFHSFCFDFSVWEMYGALLYGGRLIIVSKITARDTEKFLDILETEKVTVLNQTPSAFYNLAARSLADEERKLDLRYIIFGGEALNPRRLEKWAKKYPHTKLINMYGITETTVHVTYKEITHQDIGWNISNIGKPIPTLSTYVMDRDLRLLPLGVPGELCVGGEGVARGYLNRPGLTAEKFVDNPYLTGEILYRSGDLVKLLAGGDMEYLGRIDHQVKIRGHRVELGEIESCLLKHRNIEAVVVVAREEKKDKYEDRYICAYIVPRSNTFPINIVEIKDYLSRRLPDYMIPVYFVEMDRIPLTPNGKVDRKALPEPVLNAVETYAAPQDEVQERLVEVWSEVLGVNAEVIGIDDNFFRLGGHSLKATSLSSQIHKILDVRVPLETIFQTPTIRGLAQYIKSTSGCDPYAQMEAAEKREYYPLSLNQQAFYMLHQYAEESKLFNVPVVLPLEGDVKKGKVETVFKALIQRHEALRTSFHMIDNKPVQRIHDPVDSGQWTVDSKGENINNFIRPFDLTRAPLLRAGLIKIEKENYLLIMDMHHLVTDGTSVNILARDFWALYRGRQLSPSAIRYRDFVQWQDTLIKTGEMKAHEDYWIEELSGDLPLLDMPTDFPRPSQKSFAGDSFSFNLGIELSEGIRRLAKETGTTLYMVLLTAYTILLHKITGQTDIIIGSPVSGRVHPLLENTVGLVMDSVMMRNFPSGEKSITTLLQEVRQTTLEAFEHQVYPHEELIKKVAYKKSPGRNPIADVALTVLNMFEKETVQAFDREKDDPGPAPHEAYLHKTSKVDFTISAVDTGAEGEIPCILEYCTALFKRKSMERFVSRFRQVLKEMVDNPDMQLWEIDMIAPGEKQELIGYIPRFYPLSHAQGRIYYTEKMYPAAACSNLVFTIRYPQILDKQLLKEAVNQVIKRNDALRLRIVTVDFLEEPFQYISPFKPYSLEIKDFSNEEQLRQWIETDAREPFQFITSDLFYFAYLKFNQEESGFYMKMHHIISDGWTIFSLVHQVTEIYETLKSGKTNDEKSNPSYIGYLSDEKEYLQSSLAETDREFWHQYLLPLPEEVQLSGNKGDSTTVDGGAKILSFPGDLRTKIQHYCKANHTSIFKLLLSALSIYISAVTAKNDIVIAAANHNRTTENQRKMMGMFVSTIPLRIRIEDSLSFRDFVEKIGKETNFILKNHQKYPFDRLLAELREKTGVDPGYLLNINLIGHPDVEEDKFRIEHYFPGYEPTPLSIHINPINRNIHGILELEWDYQSQQFSSREIDRMHGYLINILNDALAYPGKKLSEIELLSAKEKKTLLYEFNNRDSDEIYPGDQMVQQLFEEQAGKCPDSTAVVGRGQMQGVGTRFIASESRNISITYNLLNNKSDQLAAALQEKGVKPDVIVGIMIEQSLEMIVGILGILKAGGAYLPIDPEYPQERKDYMLADSDACILLTQKDIVHFSSTSTLTSTCQVSPANLAYLIYTSGSTGRPKGVMVEHKNLTAYLHAFAWQFNLTAGDTVIQQASFAFDAFVEELYPILLKGGTLAIPGRDEIKDIIRLSAFIAMHRVTMITASPLLLNELNKLGTTSPRICISGGDVLKSYYIDRLLQTSDVYNTYGPTEATVCASYYKCRGQAPVNVPIGKPITGYRVYILDRNERLLPIGLSGELCISGPGVTRGYLNQPELTAEKFCLRRPGGRFLKKLPPWTPRKNFLLEGAHKDHMQSCNHAAMQSCSHETMQIAPHYPLTPLPHHPLYLTGDLACWLEDGNIRFLGRIDRQVKIRGFRIELEEIENQLLKHKAITEAAVVTRNDETNESYLCAYIAADNANVPELRGHLSKALPDYMIPSYFVQVERMPLTPTGKLDWKALSRLEGETAAPGTAYAAPSTEVEKKLEEIWQELLAQDKIGIDSSFFELGGHSLKAVSLASKIRKEFNREIPLTVIYQSRTIREMARFVEQGGENEVAYWSIDTSPSQKFYPLSSSQERLFLLDRMGNLSTAYNISTIVTIDGQLDIAALESTFKMLIQRHASLRTSFHMKREEPVQVIHEEVDFEIEYYEPVDSRGENINNFIRPFDLTRAPLLRVGLIKLAESKHILMIDNHHIIADGVSMAILVREFFTGYTGSKSLPGLKLQYKDFVLHQKRRIRAGEIKDQEIYWLERFAGELPVLNLPVDYPAPAQWSFEGKKISLHLSHGETRQIKTLAIETETSMFMVLSAVYAIFLSRLSGQEDIIVGLPTAGRRDPDLESVIGMFVNTLALRNFPVPAKTFLQFLSEVKENALQGFENQDYPFEELVKQVAVNRDTQRNPIFDTMFVLQTDEIVTNLASIPEIETSALKIFPYPFESKTSKFNLSMNAVELEDQLVFSIEYKTALFKQETIERFIDYYSTLLTSALENPGQEIGTMEFIPVEEKQRLLVDFNDTAMDYPRDKTIHQLFAEQVEQNPNHIALVGVHEGTRGLAPLLAPNSITYNQLNQKSNQLAHQLKEKGVKSDTIVGIMMERSAEMIIGILGILKAGGAYLPIDPDYPQERIDFMLKDSGARILLKKSEIRNPKFETNPNESNSNDQNKRAGVTVLNFEHLNFEFVSNFEIRASNLSSSKLAYIIYTSGSTGRPKGVMVEHKNVVRLVKNSNFIELKEKDRLALAGAFVFDITTFEIWGSLLNGLNLFLVAEDTLLNARKLKTYIDKNAISILHLTPQLFNQLAEQNIDIFANLDYFLVGGDLVLPHYINKLNEKFENIRILHMYGPTENTTFSTFFLVDRTFEERIPIGTPIANSSVYVLDRRNNPQPLGVVGELCLGGDGLARGYLNNPELTAEKFKRTVISHSSLVTGKSKRAVISHSSFVISNPSKLSTNDRSQKFLPNDRSSRLYKSGDLARWLTDGNIRFIGRIDHQVKIRGSRIELEEIENRLLTNDEIKEAVVLAIEDANDKYLCAYIVLDKGKTFSPGELRNNLKKKLPDYMIPAYFVEIGQIPLTPTGKVDRTALPAPAIKTGENYTAPGDEIEKELVEIWAETLGKDAAGLNPRQIGIDNDFFQLGGHSLKAAVLASKIHKKFNVEVPLAEIFKTPSIRAIARIIRDVKKTNFTDLEKAEKREYYPLSFNQNRLFILHQMDPQSPAYNMPMRVQLILNPETGESIVENVIRTLLERHESLRTGFKTVNHEPVQYVVETTAFPLPFRVIDISSLEEKKKQQEQGKIYSHLASAPFDLDTLPLFRSVLVKLGGEHYVFMFNMHHIISDGWSLEILKGEFFQLADGYSSGKAVQMDSLPFQYRDFSRWHNKLLASTHDNENPGLLFWKQRLVGGIPGLQLPGDFTEGIESVTGAAYQCMIDKELKEQLLKLARHNHTTLFTVMFSLYTLLLARVCQQDSIGCSVIASGREHISCQGIVGLFVNSILFKTRVDRDEPFDTFIQRMHKDVMESFQYQSYPMERVFEELNIRYPVISVSFNMLNLQDATRTQQLDSFEPVHIDITQDIKFDLEPYIIEYENGIEMRWVYRKALFEPATIEYIINLYIKLLEFFTRDPGQTLNRYKKEEKKKKTISLKKGITARV